MLRFALPLLLAPFVRAAGPEMVLIDTDSGLFGDDGAAVVMLRRRHDDHGNAPHYAEASP